jgi:hypothetical protein
VGVRHVCIDDASRVAFVQVMPDQRKESAVAFLEAAIAYFAKLGIPYRARDDGQRLVLPVKGFPGSLQTSRPAPEPYTPRTNGKAERFLQTGLREWAYARAYNTSDERTAELPRWLHRYNWHRPHGSIGSKPPTSRLGLTQDNLLRLHS